MWTCLSCLSVTVLTVERSRHHQGSATPLPPAEVCLSTSLLPVQSGLPWTIIRPGRLTDGPYTSYDLNTLLKNTSGSRQDVQLSLKDDLNGEASRIAVAGEFC